MTLSKILVIVLGLMLFTAGIFVGMWVILIPYYWPVILLGITGIIFALLGLALLDYGLSPNEQNYSFFSRGYRGLLYDLLHLSLAIVLTRATVIYQRPSDPLCGGTLSGGFPLAFLCDNAGESPIDDWGKISWGIDRPNLVGTFVDILFYFVLVWIISFMVLKIFQQVRQPMPFRQ